MEKVLHNVVYKISNGIISGFLSLLKMRTMKSKLITASSIELQKIYQRVYRFMENSRFFMNQYD
jgi:hypothetical protein